MCVPVAFMCAWAFLETCLQALSRGPVCEVFFVFYLNLFVCVCMRACKFSEVFFSSLCCSEANR